MTLWGRDTHYGHIAFVLEKLVRFLLYDRAPSVERILVKAGDRVMAKRDEAG